MLNELTSLTTLLASITWPTMISGKLATFILLVFLVILAALESWIPKRKLSKKGLRLSYRTNISLFIFNSLVLSLVSVSASPSLMLAEHYSGPGLFSNLSSSVWRAFFSFLLLDLLLYVWHKTSHEFDVLKRNFQTGLWRQLVWQVNLSKMPRDENNAFEYLHFCESGSGLALRG